MVLLFHEALFKIAKPFFLCVHGTRICLLRAQQKQTSRRRYKKMDCITTKHPIFNSIRFPSQTWQCCAFCHFTWLITCGSCSRNTAAWTAGSCGSTLEMTEKKITRYVHMWRRGTQWKRARGRNKVTLHQQEKANVLTKLLLSRVFREENSHLPQGTKKNYYHLGDVLDGEGTQVIHSQAFISFRSKLAVMKRWHLNSTISICSVLSNER